MNIRLLATGGTFDKEYNELNGNLYFNETHLPEILQLGRSRLNINIETLMMIDSLEMNSDHRKKISDVCKSCAEMAILITHGTDTMEQTARYLGELNLQKTIVITGAMVPYKFGSSDGLFNLGSALAFVQTLPSGVYVAMNGKYFSWDNVRKNKEKGEFEKLV